MKIAFIGQKGIPALSGGVEKHVEQLAVRMAKEGHDVVAYVRSSYTPIESKRFKGIRLIHVPCIHTKHLEALSYSLIASLHAVFLAQYDVIHYHSIGPSIFAFIPRLLKPSSKVIATFHSRDYFHQKWNAFARFGLRVAEHVTCAVPEKTIVISETLQKYAEERYNKKFVFIPNGAEVRYEEDTTILHEWSLKPERYILSVSRLIRHKGIHYLIKAFRELEEKSKLPNNMKLVIVGSSSNTEDYVEYLKAMSIGSDNIIFVGEQSGQKLEALFSHAALFVQPSEDEGLSLALLEAMAYELPVVVSDIEANLEAIQGGAGISFENKNVYDLREKLAFYANRSEEAHIIAKRAKERAEKEYSWDGIARRTLECYQELLMEDNHIKENYAISRSK
jgi:glycosyltransferase involved in cell wall biosynthesis